MTPPTTPAPTPHPQPLRHPMCSARAGADLSIATAGDEGNAKAIAGVSRTLVIKIPAQVRTRTWMDISIPPLRPPLANYSSFETVSQTRPPAGPEVRAKRTTVQVSRLDAFDPKATSPTSSNVS